MPEGTTLTPDELAEERAANGAPPANPPTRQSLPDRASADAGDDDGIAVRRNPETPSGPQALAAAADGPVDLITSNEALAFLLAADDDEDDEENHITLTLAVGTEAKPRDMEWVIRPVDLETLRKLSRATTNRASRRRGGVQEDDEITSSIRVIIEGTVSPDLREYARQKGIADPSTALRLHPVFKRKPGMLGQIAGRIMGLSGYDDEDVRDAREVQAAGN